MIATARCSQEVPSLVRLILVQAAKHRGNGSISSQKFTAQINRIVHEELEPNGFELLMRDLEDGRMRFLVKEKASGTVRDMFEYDPHLPS